MTPTQTAALRKVLTLQARVTAQILIHLEPTDIEKLDILAAHAGVSRAVLVQFIIKESLRAFAS